MRPAPPSPEGLFEWMERRESIRRQRQAGNPWPWTADPILREGYFTNVMREHDAGSIRVQQHITDPFIDHPWLPVMLAAARWIGDSPALRASWEAPGLWPIASIDDLLRLRDWLDRAGLPVFGGAYIASANGMRWGTWTSKTDYILRGVIVDAVPALLDLERVRTLQFATEMLDAVPGWGGFMAYEVACDLRWAPGWGLYEAADRYEWANPGPGARRGMTYVWPERWGGKRAPEREALPAMRWLYRQASGRFWPLGWDRPLEMRDIEHSLCEFSKYRRMADGIRPKRYYRPR